MSLPGWVWLLLGVDVALVIGGAIAALYLATGGRGNERGPVGVDTWYDEVGSLAR